MNVATSDRGSRAGLFFRNLLWTILLPGTVTVGIPYFIVTRWHPASVTRWDNTQLVALLSIIVGASMLLHCIWRFAVNGRATLSPLDAPRHLVVRGLYRYVRNPMYVGVMMVLLGEALLFASLVLAAYALFWFTMFNLMIILYEEPALHRQFGESYDRYRRQVGRWIPARPFDPVR